MKVVVQVKELLK